MGPAPLPALRTGLPAGYRIPGLGTEEVPCNHVLNVRRNEE